MGFLSKLWKGIKKTFKKIFKPIKKIFKSVGKFMGKIGVVGQIAMMFLPIPGLGALFGGLGSAGSKALGWLNKFGAVGQGAAKIIGSGYKFVRAVAKPFVDITKGVKGFFEDITKYVGSKIPGISDMIKSKPVDSIFGGGPNSAWSKAQETITGAFDGFRGNMSDAFSMNIDDLLPKEKIAGATFKGAVDVKPQEAIGDDFKFELGEPRTRVAPEDFDYEAIPTGAAKTAVPETFELGEPRVRVAPEDFDYESIPVEKPGSFTDTLGQQVSETTSKIGQQFQDAITDPAGFAVDQAKGFVSSQLSPTSLLSKALSKPPEMPDMYEPMRISPQFMSQKYDMMTSSMMQTDMEAFNQSSDVLGMRNMGLLQGGYGYGEPQQGFGFGGYDFNTIFENRFKQFAPAA